MNIFLTGQCTLHWGRMEYGNIGNYYIIEPFIRELLRALPDSSIKTTFQMSGEFCERENLACLPMSLYYSWSDSDLSTALEELGISTLYSKTGRLVKSTPFIEAVLQSDLVIDFSGDIWGDNADLVGENRFLIGLIKDRVAQLLQRPTVMLAGSPGPFEDQKCAEFAKTVFAGFDLVTNREAFSTELLKKEGFDVSKTKSLACPAFLFESSPDIEIEQVLIEKKLFDEEKPKIGMVICGWNMLEGPFGKWPRGDEEYSGFVEAVEYMVHELDAHVYLMSHANGFELPPKFKLIRGRDFPMAEQLYNILSEKGLAAQVRLLDGLYSPAETKAIIRHFDMLVSGRVHAAVAALSQGIPAVIIDYGHEPKAHKLKGFAQLAGVDAYLADPGIKNDLILKIRDAWAAKEKIGEALSKRIPEVCNLARENFDLLKQFEK